MSSALTIFFRNLEYDWKEEAEENERKDEDEQAVLKNCHPRLLLIAEEASMCPKSDRCDHGERDGDKQQGNSKRDDAKNMEQEDEQQEDSSSTSSEISSCSTTSTTKSLPISAFHIQIVSDNASSNCSQNQSNTWNQLSSQGPQPKRRHSTPPSPNDCGPRRPRGGPEYTRSSSSGSLLVFQRPSHKRSSWKRVDHHQDKHLDDFVLEPSFYRPHHRDDPHDLCGFGASSCSNSLTSRWHSGDQQLPARTKAPLMQPIRRNTSRDDILLQTTPTSANHSHEDNHYVARNSQDKLMYMHYQCHTHSLQNNELAAILTASSTLFSPSGGLCNER